MKVIYRISDTGYKKDKPSWINNENCLRNAWTTFINSQFIILMDDASSQTIDMIYNVTDNRATYINVNANSSAKSFNIALDYAIRESNDEIVYLLENDYVHTPNAESVIADGISMGFDYVTGYDHPDKYLNPSQGGNPFCEGKSEVSRVYCGKLSHYKITNSTTMTFAAMASTLKRDEVILRKWTTGNHPNDFNMFLELSQRGRTLVSSIPATSTHGETKWLSPMVNWESLICNN
jgi:hypothetical protein